MGRQERVTCSQCGTLLAIRVGSRVHLKLKEMQYAVDGGDFRVTAVCRRCHRMNEF